MIYFVSLFHLLPLGIFIEIYRIEWKNRMDRSIPESSLNIGNEDNVGDGSSTTTSTAGAPPSHHSLEPNIYNSETNNDHNDRNSQSTDVDEGNDPFRTSMLSADGGNGSNKIISRQLSITSSASSTSSYINVGGLDSSLQISQNVYDQGNQKSCCAYAIASVVRAMQRPFMANRKKKQTN